MSFGLRLRELRTQKKLTQQQLGDIVHVSKVSISGYENGTRTPDTDTLEAIADYFEVSIDYLLGRSMKSNKASDKVLTVAAHIDDDTTDEEMDEILDYIAYIKSKHANKEKR